MNDPGFLRVLRRDWEVALVVSKIAEQNRNVLQIIFTRNFKVDNSLVPRQKGCFEGDLFLWLTFKSVKTQCLFDSHVAPLGLASGLGSFYKHSTPLGLRFLS